MCLDLDKVQPPLQNVKNGDSVNFTCLYEGNCHWYYSEDHIDLPGNAIVGANTCELFLINITIENEGSCVCSSDCRSKTIHSEGIVKIIGIFFDAVFHLHTYSTIVYLMSNL